VILERHLLVIAWPDKVNLVKNFGKISESNLTTLINYLYIII